MTVEELDLARAKVLTGASDEQWQMFSDVMRGDALSAARAIRLGDEARGLRVVPVYATKKMLDDGEDEVPTITRMMDEELSRDDVGAIYRAMLSASPLAPEEKE